MTRESFLEYIQAQTASLANKKFKDPRLALAYQLGLTQRILAECMYADNLSAGIFYKQIKRIAREHDYKLKKQ